MKQTSYALGMSVANNVLASGIENLNVEEFTKAFKAVLAGEATELSASQAQSVLNEFFSNLEAKHSSKMKEEGEKFLNENKKQDGVITLASGLQYKVLKTGNGKQATAKDTVECHYEGRLINGVKFDSSYDRGETATFGVTQVIQGWVEALQLMKEGDKWQLFIPYNLAYGERGAGQSIPPYATLIFDIEVIKVK